MSDYFGALIRSSGISIGVRTGIAPSFSAFGLESTGEEPAAPGAIAVPPAAAFPQAIIGQVPEPGARVSADAAIAAPRAPGVPDERAVVVRAMPPDRADVLAGPVDPYPGSGVDAPVPDRAHAIADSRPAARTPALIEAALQWVAAGNARGEQPGADSTPPASPLTLPVEAAASSVTAPAMERAAAMPSADAPVRMPAAPALPEAAALAPRALPIRAESPERAVPRERAEAVEVTIGAIHVRVDAPAAQTVARPAVPAAAPAVSAATSPTSRSRLARRALRRI